MNILHLLFMMTAICSEASTRSRFQPPRLLVVSYDGFRYDYFNRGVTPFLKSLRDKNTYSEYMKNIFVTKTFPNHHTISTGLYAETHGVIDSEFYDSILNKTFKYTNQLYHYNNDILPIWTLNENGNVNRHSGVVMWPGSAFEYNGKNITFVTSFNMSVPWKKRVDELISWFRHPKTPINFGMLYIEEPDFHGHGIGINNARFNSILEKLDFFTQYLHAQLKEKCLSDVNIIHLSDHGMSTVTMNRIVNLTQYIDPADYVSAGSSPVINIFPHDGKGLSIYNKLKNASETTNKFNVYLKNDIPLEYHFSNNTRIGPILVVAKEGYAFQTLYDSIPYYIKEFNITVSDKSEFGSHGYDNNLEEMHPFFFGMGPAFLPECQLQPFDSVDLLPLFCEILEITCPSVNGTIENLQKCLTKYHNEAILYKGIYIGGIVISVLGIIILYLVHLQRKRTEKLETQYRILTEDADVENHLWDEKDQYENSAR